MAFGQLIPHFNVVWVQVLINAAGCGKASWLELAAGRTGRVNGDYDFALGVALFEVKEGFGCGA